MILLLIFLLLAVLWLLACFLPNWSGPATFNSNSVFRFVVGLVVLLLLYLVIAAVLGRAGILV